MPGRERRTDSRAKTRGQQACPIGVARPSMKPGWSSVFGIVNDRHQHLSRPQPHVRPGQPRRVGPKPQPARRAHPRIGEPQVLELALDARLQARCRGRYQVQIVHAAGATRKIRPRPGRLAYAFTSPTTTIISTPAPGASPRRTAQAPFGRRELATLTRAHQATRIVGPSPRAPARSSNCSNQLRIGRRASGQS